MHSARGLAPALLSIGSMSPPGYPSAWLPPGRARLRFTWQVHCSSAAPCCSQVPVCPSERSRSRGGRCGVGEVGSRGTQLQIKCGSQEVPVTHLRKVMLEELQRRHYSEATTRYYIRKVEAFARHFHTPPDRLGRQHIREYQAYLFTKRKLSPGSVTNHLCALRFFYIQTLKKPWSIADTPYPKKTHRLPTILSQEEVAQLIDAACTPFHRTILMTLYATGIRNAELTRLKISDIDSQRMVIHIQGGKGRKDRDVMLSPVLLQELRAHWRRLRKKSIWLFP